MWNTTTARVITMCSASEKAGISMTVRNSGFSQDWAAEYEAAQEMSPSGANTAPKGSYSRVDLSALASSQPAVSRKTCRDKIAAHSSEDAENRTRYLPDPASYFSRSARLTSSTLTRSTPTRPPSGASFFWLSSVSISLRTSSTLRFASAARFATTRSS